MGGCKKGLKLLFQAKDNEKVDLTNRLKLEFFKLEKIFERKLSLKLTNEDSTLKNTKEIKSQEK